MYATEWAVPMEVPWKAMHVVALVREPLRLTLSLCAESREPGIKANLSSCIEQRSSIHNFQTRRYAGCSSGFAPCQSYLAFDMVQEAPPLGREHYARALAFLNRATLVLLTERLHEASGLLASVLGWNRTDATALRSGTHRNRSDTELRQLEASVGLPALAALRRASTMDYELHAHAEKLFAASLGTARAHSVWVGVDRFAFS